VTVAPPAAAGQRVLAAAALDRAQRHLLDGQDARGCWPSAGYVQVSLDAEDMLYREFAGLRTSDFTAAAARWIRSRQQADGSWAGRSGGDGGDEDPDGDLTVSVLAYIALRLAGDSPDAYHLAMAAGWIRDAGGLAAAGVRARIWLALYGLAEWEDLPVPPPEAVYLPPSFPVGLPGKPGWGRPTLVPLAVLGALRPVRELGFRLAELQVTADDDEPPAVRGLGRRVSGVAAVDHGLQVYRHSLQLSALGAARAAALRACGEWIIAGQAADGSWRGSLSGWLFSLIALRLLGRSPDDLAITRGQAALDATSTWTTTPEGPMRRLEIASAPVTASALAVSALADSGLPRDHPALQAGAIWLLDEEIGVRARWLSGRHELAAGEAAVTRGLPAGVEETAAVVLALRRASLAAAAGQLPTTVSALRWLTAMQRKDGGWGRFAAGPGSGLATRLPLFDRGEVRDASAAETTAWAVRALAAAGQPGSRAIRRGVTWLLRAQLPDGSWPGPDGAADLLATATVLEALLAAGVVAAKPPVVLAADWLAQRQQADGGWAGSLPGRPGASGSAPLPTARALAVLLRMGDPAHLDTIERGTAFLLMSQRTDGTWAGPQSTQIGAPALVTDTAALGALGRYLAIAGRPAPGPS
jgi:squalene-hopene/tetraprenyl-beta-curcumene cyclase